MLRHFYCPVTCQVVRGSSAFTPCLEHVRAGGGGVMPHMHCFNAMIALGIILCLWITPYLYGVTYVS